MGKKFDETLEYLGTGYCSKVIDLEKVIYRRINNREIEISGLNGKGKYDATIYIWENLRQIASIQNIHSKEELAKHLETVLQELSDP